MKKAFTLVEMIIVMVILGIIVMLFMGLTGDQIAKLQQKTVKDALLSSYQQHYSRNLTSSTYAGEKYDKMLITLMSGANEIVFSYATWYGDPFLTESFSDNFIIQHIFTTPWGGTTASQLGEVSRLQLSSHPYEIDCEMESASSLVLVITMLGQKEYCFEITAQSCRMKQIACTAAWSENFTL